MKRDYLGWLTMLACVVVTAHGEWSLAVAAGYQPLVAGALPVAIDAYALRAMKTGREVFWPVALMVATNAAAHLVHAALLPVTAWLVVAVSAIAPVVLWRVHRLSEAPAVKAAESHPEPAGRYGDPVVRPVPEPIYAAPEPQPEPPEPAPEPITIERAPEPAPAPPQAPVLGAFVPVAELMGGTTGTTGGTSPDLRVSGRPEALPRWAEPAPEPAAEPVPPAGSDLEPDDTADTRFDQYVEDARAWIRADPNLTGTAVGQRLGKSDAYGRRVRRAALDSLART
ncbi:hypothetical protein OG292_22475 [Streptomyces sp. NBC_01511]|uniref:hypothetical protein n=1 Tax=Streptomyces sp. NBC_01511 TaxID=2903889 RepID=UPI00386ABAA8